MISRIPVMALLAGVLVATGCSSQESATTSEPVELLRTRAPLESPVWAPTEKSLLALEEGGQRVVKVDPSNGEFVDSLELEDAAEDMVVDPSSEEDLYLAQPSSGRVLLLDSGTLERLRGMEAGASPAQIAVHPTSETLLALSKEGDTVTGVDMEGYERSFQRRVEAGPDGLLAEGAETLEPDFWVVGEHTVTHYNGDPTRRWVQRRLEVSGEAFAPALETIQQTYAGDDAGLALLMEGDPQGLLEGSLQTGEERKLHSPARFMESAVKEELRVYAVTEDRLLALRHDTLKTAGYVDFAGALKDAGLAGAQVSGMAVGKERVYLTLEREPYVLSIAKP